NYGQGELLESIGAAQVSHEYFDVLQPPLLMGRWFTAEEDLPNAGYTVMLSYNFWTQHLNSDPDVLGKSVTLSGNPYTVVGVVAREFDVRDIGPPPEIWVPFQLDPNTVDQGHFLPERGAPEAGCHARAGAGAAHDVGVGVSRAIQRCGHAADGGFQRDHASRGARAPGAPDAARRARSRRLRAADRVRERREPAPDSRDGAAKGTRRAHRARRGALAHHAAAPDGEPDAVVGRRSSRSLGRLFRNALADDREHGRLAAARPSRLSARHGLAHRLVHRLVVDRDRSSVRAHPRARRVARRLECRHQGLEQPLGQRFPAEQDTLGARARRG